MNKKKLVKHTRSYQDDLIATLQDPDECAAYMQVAFDEYQEDGDTEILLTALRNVTTARGGITRLSELTHLNRQNLYKTLSNAGNPRLDTFGLIIRALGFHLSIQPASKRPSAKRSTK